MNDRNGHVRHLSNKPFAVRGQVITPTLDKLD